MTDRLTNLINRGFYMMPNFVYKNYGLSPFEMAVYAGITYHADSKTGHAFPGIKLLAKETKMSENKVSQCISRLEELKLIYVERDTKPEKGEHRERDNNHYYLLQPKQFPEVSAPESGGSTPPDEVRTSPDAVQYLTGCGTVPHGVGHNNTQEQDSMNNLTAPHEGVPSAVALGGSDSTPKRNLPHHMLVNMPAPAAVKDEPPSELGAKHPDITGRSFVQFCMTEWNMNGLNDKLYKGFTGEAYEYYEGHRIPKGDLMSNWDHTPGFENFARSRFEMFRAKANREKAGSGSWAADYLSNLKKFSTETNGGKGWPGFNQWKRENPSQVKQVSREDKPPKIIYVEMPDEGPKFWEVE